MSRQRTRSSSERRAALRAQLAAHLARVPDDLKTRILQSVDTPATPAQVLALTQGIDALPPAQRAAFILRFSLGRSIAQIAAQMQLGRRETEGLVMSALVALREHMDSPTSTAHPQDAAVPGPDEGTHEV